MPSALLFRVRKEEEKQENKQRRHIFFFSYLSCDSLEWKIFVTNMTF